MEQDYTLHEVVAAAARDVDSADFLFRRGNSGRIPSYLRADRTVWEAVRPDGGDHVYALLGSLIFTLTLVPVLASYWFKKGIKEVVNRPYEWIKKYLRRTP